MRQRIRLDTVTDIANFVLIASQVRFDVYLTNDNGLKVNGKSFLGVAHAHEFDSLWCECDEDIYTKIQNFIVE
jgi:hypothetical protein